MWSRFFPSRLLRSSCYTYTARCAHSGARAPPRPKMIQGVKQVIAVSSNKGGVGKSTTSVNLGLGLSRKGYSVGLLDADIYGPSFPLLFNLHDHQPRVNQDQKLIPLENFGVKVMSMGFLTPRGVAASWRGPMLMSAVNQMLFGVEWGDIDVLVVDLPPGTGDTQISLVQTVQLTGAVLISTPQQLALEDVQRGLDLFQKCNVKVAGLIENMSYYQCSKCSEKHYIFGEGGVKQAAEKYNIPFLGEIPLHENVTKFSDAGSPVVVADGKSIQAEAYYHIVDQVVEFLQKQPSPEESQPPIEFE